MPRTHSTVCRKWQDQQSSGYHSRVASTRVPYSSRQTARQLSLEASKQHNSCPCAYRTFSTNSVMSSRLGSGPNSSLNFSDDIATCSCRTLYPRFSNIFMHVCRMRYSLWPSSDNRCAGAPSMVRSFQDDKNLALMCAFKLSHRNTGMVRRILVQRCSIFVQRCS